MPIILSVIGHAALAPHRLTRQEARDWLGKAAVWFEGLGDSVLDARVVRDAEEKPVLLVTFHPATTPVEIRLGASGRVRITAATTPAGPGYHAHLCQRLQQFADDFDLTWDETGASDPSGYFISGFTEAGYSRPQDFAAVQDAFLEWLGKECGTAVARLGDGPVAIGLPANHGFTLPGPVLTPLGPRDAEWLAAAAGKPAAGRDFFPWWNNATDADFYRGRALTRLWCEFFWRPPLTEEEGELADQIAADLATAYKLDPADELPWKEWLEVLCAIENDENGHTVTPTDPSLTEAVTQRAWESDPAAPAIGYRRFPVRVPLYAGWSLEVPGDFASEWDDERTWIGWNCSRTVWFHAVGFTKPDGSRPTAAEAVAMGRRSLPPGTPVPTIDRDGLRGDAVFGEVEEDGRQVWRVSGITATEGQLVVCHVYVEDPDDRDWAIQTWHSLRHG